MLYMGSKNITSLTHQGEPGDSSGKLGLLGPQKFPKIQAISLFSCFPFWLSLLSFTPCSTDYNSYMADVPLAMQVRYALLKSDVWLNLMVLLSAKVLHLWRLVCWGRSEAALRSRHPRTPAAQCSPASLWINFLISFLHYLGYFVPITGNSTICSLIKAAFSKMPSMTFC